MSVCRVCMNDVDEDDEANSKHLFHNEYKGKKLNEILESVVQEIILEQDPGPPYVCNECYGKLTMCYDFLNAYSKSKIVFHLLGKSKKFKQHMRPISQVTTSQLKRKHAGPLPNAKVQVRRITQSRDNNGAMDLPPLALLNGAFESHPIKQELPKPVVQVVVKSENGDVPSTSSAIKNLLPVLVKSEISDGPSTSQLGLELMEVTKTSHRNRNEMFDLIDSTAACVEEQSIQQ